MRVPSSLHRYPRLLAISQECGGYYRDQRFKLTFYTMSDQMYSLHHQEKIKAPFWAREITVSHEEIDDDSEAIDG